MLDPEQLTFAQWFWIVFVMVVVVMFACRCISLYYPDEPLTNEQPSPSAITGQPTGAPSATGNRVAGQR
jgi:hypothetical protein